MKATVQASMIWCGAVLLVGSLVGCTPPGSAGYSTPPAIDIRTPGPSPVTSMESPSTLLSPPSATTAPTDGSGARTNAALQSVGVLGVNDNGCRSTERPVILLHGTFSTVASNFSAMVPSLVAAGRCVFALEYGNGGIAAVMTSAGEFAGFVTSVEAATGARQVDVIAYSQGGLVLRTALRLNDLAGDVATAVLIAPSWNGTTSSLAGALPASLCPACADQVANSSLLRRLAVGGDLDGTVRYAEISTRGDTVVTPIGSQVPTGPADRVRSLVVEDRCPGLVTDHVRLPAVPGVIHWVAVALATDGRPSPTDLTC